MREFILLMRPKQWLKNTLVCVAPVAAGNFANAHVIFRTSGVFASFSLVASGLYAINDVRDLEKDRLHPRKKNRPVASGAITPIAAVVAGISLLVLGIGLGFVLSLETAAIVGIYCVTTLGYSFGLKDVPMLELAIVASGFVLRAAAGGVATKLPLTNWFLLVALFGSLFIVAGKRYAEVLEMGTGSVVTRTSNEFYSTDLLSQLLTITCSATLVTYCIFAFDRAGVSSRGNLYELTVAPFCIAVLRYLSALHNGAGGEPEAVFFSDRWLQALGLAWAVLFLFAAGG